MIDYISYLKLAGGLLLTTPLQIAFWSYDFTLFYSVLITGIIYVISIIFGIFMLNYLENGDMLKPLKNAST